MPKFHARDSLEDMSNKICHGFAFGSVRATSPCALNLGNELAQLLLIVGNHDLLAAVDCTVTCYSQELSKPIWMLLQVS